VAGNRAEVEGALERVRAGLADGQRTPYELIADVIGPDASPAMAPWGLQLALAYLDHLAVLGEAREVEGSDPLRWQLA